MLKNPISIFITIILSIAVGSVLSLAPYTSLKAATTPVCSLTSQPDRIVINFNGTKIRSDQGQSQAISGPVAVAIPAGDYQVTLVSFDDHTNKVSTQPAEKWYLNLRDSLDQIIADSNSISDLPETQDYLTETVGTVTLSQAVTKAFGVHTAYPGAPSPANSVTPVCAALDKVNAPTSTPTPENPSTSSNHSDPTRSVNIEKTDGRTTVRPGETINYTIEVSNTGEEDLLDLEITDTVPAGLAITQVSSNATQQGNTIIWSDLVLSGGEKINLTVTTKVKDDLKDNHTLKNVVKVRSEDKGLSDTATDVTVVKRTPQVAATSTTTPNAIQPVPITAPTGSGLLGAAAVAGGALVLALRRLLD